MTGAPYAKRSRASYLAERAERLAHHFTKAGRADKAIGYWQEAGQRALERSADAEADAVDWEGGRYVCKRLVVTPRSRADGCWRPVPGQEVVETVHGITVDHAPENVAEVSIGLDIVELCRGYQ